MNEISMTGKKIQAFRRERGYSLEQVAVAAESTPTHLHKIEEGIFELTTEMMKTLKTILEMPDEMFSQEEIELMEVYLPAIKKEKITGETIKTFRKERGYTLEQVAVAAKVTPAYISRIENGTSALTTEMLRKFKTILGMPDESFSQEEIEKINQVDVYLPIADNRNFVKQVVDFDVLKDSTLAIFKGKVISEDKIKKIIDILNQN